ncbi:restriction endonuclease subunit S [Roseomonas sp. 18066]|uniref:restriction endonuclease subunit S n=1 Tax=Roseomonas sp. 18066 TaxID=2681412 RepID=UPI0013570E2D|nr:restriction endonuclease subunit S [Roseomonas sp. 18066]
MPRLNELAEIVRGVSFDKEDASDTPSPERLPILRAGNIQETLHLDENLVFVPHHRVSTRQMLLIGDIVICMSSGSSEIVGKTAVLEGHWVGSVGAFCAIIRPRKGISVPGYIASWLRSPAFRAWSSRSEGINIKNIRRSELEQLEVPLPPSDEQNRIVDLLDRTTSIRRLRRQAQETARQIVPALFNKMFGDPVANSMGWAVRPLGEIVAGFEGGRNLQADAETGANGVLKILKVSAVTSGSFRATEAKPAPPNYVPPSHHFVRDGDLLISRANTAELVGATAMVRNPPPNLLLPDKIWRVLWREPTQVTPEFLLAWFKQPGIRAAMSRLSSGTSVSMRNISQGRLSTVGIILPPLELQRQFAAQSASLERLTMDQMTGQHIERALTVTLQANLFSG